MGPDFVDHIGPFDDRKLMKNCFETESAVEENRLDLGHQVYSHICGYIPCFNDSCLHFCFHIKDIAHLGEVKV